MSEDLPPEEDFGELMEESSGEDLWRLPPELLGLVASCLGSVSRRQMRAVCRQWNAVVLGIQATVHLRAGDHVRLFSWELMTNLNKLKISSEDQRSVTTCSLACVPNRVQQLVLKWVNISKYKHLDLKRLDVVGPIPPKSVLKYLRTFTNLQRLRFNPCEAPAEKMRGEILNQLRDLPQLKQFSIGCLWKFNSKEHLSEDIRFLSLTKLDTLRIEDRSTICKSLFNVTNLMNLTRLQLSSSLPKWSRELTNLKSLAISSPRGDVVFLSFGDMALLTQLTELNLYDTEAENMHLISNLYNLKTLTITGDPFITVDEALASLTGLTNLNLSKNEMIGDIPDRVSELCSLTRLDLSCSSFSKLRGRCLPISLQHLKMKGARGTVGVTEIDADFGQRMTNLISLDLSRNSLTQLESKDIPPSVRRLKLHGNDELVDVEFIRELQNLDYCTVSMKTVRQPRDLNNNARLQRVIQFV